MPSPPARVPTPSQPVVRRFVASNFAAGILCAAVGAATLAFYSEKHRIPVLVVAIAVVSIAGGLALVASGRARVCAACDAPLRLVGVRFGGEEPVVRAALGALRSGDGATALRHLGAVTPGGHLWAELWHCPACRSVAVLRLSGVEAVIAPSMAARLVDAVAPAPAADEDPQR